MSVATRYIPRFFGQENEDFLCVRITLGMQGVQFYQSLCIHGVGRVPVCVWFSYIELPTRLPPRWFVWIIISHIINDNSKLQGVRIHTHKRGDHRRLDSCFCFEFGSSSHVINGTQGECNAEPAKRTRPPTPQT